MKRLVKPLELHSTEYLKGYIFALQTILDSGENMLIYHHRDVLRNTIIEVELFLRGRKTNDHFNR